jgi:thiol peroxidase
MERPNAVKVGGNPVTLMGKELKVGDKAPDFTLLDNNMNPVKLSDSKGKPRLLSIVSSLDTGTCSIQTRTFNKELAELADKATAYTISADLPFAQGRFVKENDIDKVQFLSDYKTVEFGNDYGLLIKETRLLARAVIVVDKDDTITYMQVVPEVSSEPDYAPALEALRKTIG